MILIYHGGNAGSGAIGVETAPAIYLIFWGPDWANGFTTTDANGGAYTSQLLQSYVTSFLSNLGGTSWAAIQNEYCNNVPVGRPAVQRWVEATTLPIRASNSRVCGPMRRPYRATSCTGPGGEPGG